MSNVHYPDDLEIDYHADLQWRRQQMVLHLRGDLAGADGGGTGLELTTRHACGGSSMRAAAVKTRLKMNGGPAMTINLRR